MNKSIKLLGVELFYLRRSVTDMSALLLGVTQPDKVTSLYLLDAGFTMMRLATTSTFIFCVGFRSTAQLCLHVSPMDIHLGLEMFQGRMFWYGAKRVNGTRAALTTFYRAGWACDTGWFASMFSGAGRIAFSRRWSQRPKAVYGVRA